MVCMYIMSNTFHFKPTCMYTAGIKSRIQNLLIDIFMLFPSVGKSVLVPYLSSFSADLILSPISHLDWATELALENTLLW